MPVGGNPKKPTRVGEEEDEEEECFAAGEFLAPLMPLPPPIAIPGEPPPWLFIQLLTRCSGL
jgi:hypothetical protein